MKNIFKIFLAFGLLVFVSACDSLDLDEIAINPNSVTPENADINLVMNNILIELGDLTDEVSDETMPYVRMAAMTGGDRYDNQDAPNNFDFTWSLAYAQIIPDCNTVITLANDAGLTRHSGIANIVKAYTMMTMVDLFGNVPYSQAFQGTDQQNPAIDNGADVYAAALGLLEKAIADLNNASGEVSNDIFYDGDETKWIKLANSLKLRYFVNTRLVNGDATAQINALISANNMISAADEDFAFQYGTTRANPDSRHPYYADGYEVGGPSWYMSNHAMWMHWGETFTEDPRLRYYYYRQDCDETDEDFFTLNCQELPYPTHFPAGLPWCTASSDFGDPAMKYTGYWGRDHGNDDGIPPDDLKRTAWGLYPAGGKFDADDCMCQFEDADMDGEPDNPNDCANVSNMGTDGGGGAGIQPIIMSSFVNFLRAEAALTLGTADDARAQLEAGVKNSIAKVTSFSSIADVDPAFEPDQTAIDDYVTEVLNKFDNADDDGKLDLIMKQYMVAAQGNGLEIYNGYRRTCKPSNLQPLRLADQGEFPRTMWYPANFVNRNSDPNAKQKDNLTVTTFWDTNPAGCAK